MEINEVDYSIDRLKGILNSNVVDIRKVLDDVSMYPDPDGNIKFFMFVRSIFHKYMQQRKIVKHYAKIVKAPVGFEGKQSEELEKDYKLSKEMVRENLLSKKIANQTKLMSLIPKAEAKERVETALEGVKDVISYSIRQMAPRLVGLRDGSEAEMIMASEWNKAIDLLESASKIVEWEVDGSFELLQTRLMKMVQKNPDVYDLINTEGRNSEGRNSNEQVEEEQKEEVQQEGIEYLEDTSEDSLLADD